MNKRHSSRAASDMRAEYDFSGGVRGKYAERYRVGVNVILLEPEVEGKREGVPVLVDVAWLAHGGMEGAPVAAIVGRDVFAMSIFSARRPLVCLPGKLA